MKIQRSISKDSWTVRPTGPLTAGKGARALRHAVRQALDRPGQRVRVDLSDVPYVDAAGVGVLLRCRQQALAAGKSIELEGVGGRILEVLRVAGLGEGLEVRRGAGELACTA